MTPRPTGHALTLPGFVLLAVLISGPVDAGDSTLATGTIRGTAGCRVEIGIGQFAKVMLDNHLVAETDEYGRFQVHDVLPGSYDLEIRQVGLQPARLRIIVGPREDTVVDIDLCPIRTSIEHMRDSLKALGLWPPRLEEGLRAEMARCSLVTAQRTVPDTTSGPPRVVITSGWKARGAPLVCDRAWQDTLARGFERGDFASPAMGDKHMCGGFEPGVRISFMNAGSPADSVSALLCFKCFEFSILSSKGRHQFAFFGDGQQEFVHFARHFYKDDQALMKVVDRNTRAGH
jgi:hypothetical protein